jgi:molecular chaperone GrpE (heat shock protein)
MSDSSGASDSRPGMSDFEAALQARLTRNAELARERAEAEAEMERILALEQEDEQRRQRELEEARLARHELLVKHLTKVAQHLKAASPEDFVVRLGWTETGQEFIAKISTRTLEPARSLFVELDRDDDEVLVRWHSDIGDALELWRLLEVEPPLLEALVLQIADQQLWQGQASPPPFPRPDTL